METETYEDAITILKAEANDLLNKGENNQLIVDSILAVAGFLQEKREEIRKAKEGATLPDEGNK